MRCVACGAEMLLVKVAPDTTMISSGYERYTLQCLGCDRIDEHLLYHAEMSSRLAEPVPGISALTSACIEDDDKLDESEVLLRRAIAMIRGPHVLSGEPLGLQRGSAAQPACAATDDAAEWDGGEHAAKA